MFALVNLLKSDLVCGERKRLMQNTVWYLDDLSQLFHSQCHQPQFVFNHFTKFEIDFRILLKTQHASINFKFYPNESLAFLISAFLLLSWFFKQKCHPRISPVKQVLWRPRQKNMMPRPRKRKHWIFDFNQPGRDVVGFLPRFLTDGFLSKREGRGTARISSWSWLRRRSL